MIVNGKKFPVNVLDRRPGYWAQFSFCLKDDTWDIVDEESMDLVQQWCVDNNCGLRMSYDTFRFKTEQELQFFMLKWG